MSAPLVTGDLAVTSVLLAYGVACLATMRIFFRNEWSRAKKSKVDPKTKPEKTLQDKDLHGVSAKCYRIEVAKSATNKEAT